MDLVDLIDEKRFLGQEFLTWLWFKSDERGGTIFLPESGSDIQLVFEKHMLLEYGEGEAHEKVICRGLQTELKEARTGLAMGKKLEQARIQLIRDDHEWHLTLRGSLMEFQGVRLPKTMANSEESDEPEAIEARLLDQIGLYEMVVRTVDQLYRMFLEVRTGSGWSTELTKMQAWVEKASAL